MHVRMPIFDRRADDRNAEIDRRDRMPGFMRREFFLDDIGASAISRLENLQAWDPACGLKAWPSEPVPADTT